MSYRIVRLLTVGVIALSIGGLGGCGFLSLDENSESVRDLIEQNRDAWEEGGITSYQFTYNKTLGDTEQDSIRVIVRGGQIDSVSVGGQAVDDPGAYLTVDRLYDEIVTNFEREDRGQFRVQFNEEFAYPERYRMGAGEETRGRGVVVTSFSRMAAPGVSEAQTDGRRARTAE
jgi:hypothetical protein